MSQYVLCVFLYFVPVHIVKYVYKHVLKQIVHARTLTLTRRQRHDLRVYCSFHFVWFSYRIVSFHYKSFNPSPQFSRSLSLSLVRQHIHSTRFDHFHSANLFTLYHFNLIRALILSRLRIHYTLRFLLNICVCVSTT